MLSRVAVFALVLLAAFVIQTAVRIEALNIQAGNYLPRKDRNPDGTLADGKWRAGLENTPRDQLRGLVKTVGQWQYLLAPLLLILAVALFLTSRELWTKFAGAVCGFVAVVAVTLMLFREYYQSLGY
jgi:hypothetical protein